MTKKEVQEAAWKHWYDNLIKTMSMQWEAFKQKRAKADLYFLLKGQVEEYPIIFGSGCPYCNYVRKNAREFDWENHVCEGCPLCEYKDPEEGDCCRAWEEVYKAFKEADFKSAALVACAKMIQKIEEDGLNWRW